MPIAPVGDLVEAKRLLRETDKKLTEISEITGVSYATVGNWGRKIRHKKSGNVITTKMTEEERIRVFGSHKPKTLDVSDTGMLDKLMLPLGNPWAESPPTQSVPCNINIGQDTWSSMKSLPDASSMNCDLNFHKLGASIDVINEHFNTVSKIISMFSNKKFDMRITITSVEDDING